MTNPSLFLICPMFGDECRHCSHETTTRPFTKIQKNGVTNLYEPKGIGKKIIELGEYCNNACAWVRDLHYCPSRWVLMRGEVKAERVKRKYVRKETKNKMESKKNKQHKPNTRASARRPAKVAKSVTKPRLKKLLKKKV